MNQSGSWRAHASHMFAAVLEENKVRLKLSITDTPGFGDQIDNSNWSVLHLTLSMALTGGCFSPSSSFFCIHTSTIFIFESWNQILQFVDGRLEDYMNAEVRSTKSFASFFIYLFIF